MSEPDERRVIEAVVQAGQSESRYIRTGRGRKMLLLVPRQRTAWLDGSLVRSLAEQYCVVVPELPAGAGATVSLEAWLTAFLDGTGYAGITIVAEAELEPALRHAALGDERIERLAFVDGVHASVEAVLALLDEPRD